jgi:hypothetical protein
MVALLSSGAQILAAQGITSSAVAGRVTSEARGTVENAIVVLTNTSTGARQQTSTSSAGRYNFENVNPGGPYTIDVRSIGFQAATKTGIRLTLGQRYIQDFELAQQVVTLEELTVIAATNPLINSGRTGAAQIVTDTAIQRLPLLGRNFTDLLRTSPQVLSGSGVGGQNSKFNTILVDGGANNDVFGVSATPGSSAGAKLISLEALQEFQILVAPFDVRQGSFSGGLVNGITKSGTNQLHGSAFTYFQRPEMVGADTGRAKLTPQQAFDIKQYGGTIGGPIIPNRLHFFASADVQSSQRAFFGLEATEPATGIPVALAERVQSIIKTKYGFDPGGVAAPGSLDSPDKNLFGKLTWQVAGSTQLETSYSYVHAAQDNFNRTARTDPNRDGWQLNQSGYKIANTNKVARTKLTTLIGGANLEVLFGYMQNRDARELPNKVPLIMVHGALPNTYLAAGGEKFSHGNELDQDVYEATANLTFGLGKNHQITVGTHNEFFKFRNLFAQNRYGTWSFASADSLEAGLPRYYEALLEARTDGFTARFSVKQLGGYIQDAWRPNDRLTVTAGLRFDTPYFKDKPSQNNAKALIDTLKINTGQFPSGNANWAPRVGFNWDPAGTGNTIVRGGVGVFSGRPPYVWTSNAFTGTGLEQVTITCSRIVGVGTQANIPGFTLDVNNLPRACGGGAEVVAPAAVVSYFDKGFKFQQALKYALGLDQRLPGGMVFTFDYLYTSNRNQLYQTDDNVKLGAVDREGRQLYATPTAQTLATTLTRLTKVKGVTQVVHHSNRSADRAWLATFQLQKSFAAGYFFSVAYTRAKSEDLISLTSSIATSNLRNTPVDGTLENRNLRLSGFDVPHKISISGSANLPWGLQASAVYTARAGTPYAYVTTNDVNGDGMTTNDLIYVPRDANDISIAGANQAADWDRLNAFIVSEKCLREQRGRIMQRTSCRNPWQKFLDLRLTKVLRTVSGQNLQITADIFNFLNLVNKNWGINRETNFFQQVSFLTGSTYNTNNTATPIDDRWNYTVPATMPALRRALVESSRWRMQFGAKYVF